MGFVDCLVKTVCEMSAKMRDSVDAYGDTKKERNEYNTLVVSTNVNKAVRGETKAGEREEKAFRDVDGEARDKQGPLEAEKPIAAKLARKVPNTAWSVGEILWASLCMDTPATPFSQPLISQMALRESRTLGETRRNLTRQDETRQGESRCEATRPCLSLNAFYFYFFPSSSSAASPL